MIGSALSLTQLSVRSRLSGGPVIPIDAPFISVAPDGWRAEYDSAPVLPGSAIIQRPGFNSIAEPVTLDDFAQVTTRTRETYPNQSSLTQRTAALSDYICKDDIVPGATNNSMVSYPKPVANWSMPHRLAVGNTVRVSLVAFHHFARQGKQVAAVKFIATDGTNSTAALVTDTVANLRPGDQQPVVEYEAALDISTLNEGVITVNAEIYPHIGDAASVLKSVNNIEPREFSPRFFLKDTGLAAAPPFAYVSASGNNSTGVVSTNRMTAKGTPFLTVEGAIAGILAANGEVDGAVIRVGAGSFALTAAFAVRTQRAAALTIERDPDIARESSIVTLASSFRPRLSTGLVAPVTSGALRFHDITIRRTANVTFSGESAAPLDLFFENVTFDNGGVNGTWMARAHSWIFGMDLRNPASSAVGAATHEFRITRGLKVTSIADIFSYEGWLLLGCSIRRTGALARGLRSYSGAIYAFNRFHGCEGNSAVISWGTSADASGCAAVQNVFEFTGAAAGPVLRPTGDSATGNLDNIILHHNSFAGHDIHGRGNLFYDDGPTPRTSNMISARGNIHVQVNCKGDVFMSDGARTGNRAYLYGVGCGDEFTQFAAANGDIVGQGASFAQDFAGPGAIYGTSNTIRNDPQYVDNKATDGVAAGAGLGDYRLQLTSPCKGSAREALLSHDLDGTARPKTSDSRGAYV